MVAGPCRQESEFRKSFDEFLDGFDITGQEIRMCFYVPIVVGFFRDFPEEGKPLVGVREKVYAVRMRRIKKAVCGNENLYSRALGKDPFILFFGVGGFGGIDHIDTNFARQSSVESPFCGSGYRRFFRGRSAR